MALTPSEYTEWYDSDYTKMTVSNADASGSIFYRRVGCVVSVYVYVTLTSATSSWVDFGTLPLTHIPPASQMSNSYFPIYEGDSANDGVRIQNTGKISGRNNNGTNVRCFVTYLV